MKYLVYISAAEHLMNHDELLEILTVSRKNNEKNLLTGILLYGEGTFIQVLEGDEKALNDTYKNILADLRHKNVIKLMEGEITERQFPEWRMGFKSANAAEMAEISAFVNPRLPDFLQTESDPLPVIKVLRTFVQSNRMNG
jgi:hypothetical protein